MEILGRRTWLVSRLCRLWWWRQKLKLNDSFRGFESSHFINTKDTSFYSKNFNFFRLLTQNPLFGLWSHTRNYFFYLRQTYVRWLKRRVQRSEHGSYTLTIRFWQSQRKKKKKNWTICVVFGYVKSYFWSWN